MSGSQKYSAARRLKQWRVSPGFVALFAAALLVVAGLFGVWWFSPAPIDALAWQPPPRPSVTGALVQNGRLLTADLIGQFQSPQGVALDRAGRLYTGTADGKIYRVSFGSQNQRSLAVFASTGGRPLGLAFDAHDNLLVADERRGLLSIDPTGKVAVLAAANSANSLAIARDGAVYFSTATTRLPTSDVLLEWLEAKPSGRLNVYDPKTGQVRVLLDGLYYARGVALNSAQDTVFVCESARYRVARYALTGSKAGRRDNLIENLPGFPAGLALGTGKLYLTIAEPRNDNIDRAHPNPVLKNLLAKLPASWVRGNEKGYGLVLVLDERGTLRESLQDPTGRINRITSTALGGPFLYLGTATDNGIGRYRRP